jgi:dolichyl-phosphate-mannose--protein O-mannosyl transferase
MLKTCPEQPQQYPLLDAKPPKTHQGFRKDHEIKRKHMDKIKLTGQNLGCIFNYRRWRFFICHAIAVKTKTAKLNVENLSRTTLIISSARCQAPKTHQGFSKDHEMKQKHMDKIKLKGQYLGCIFNYRRWRVFICHTIVVKTKTAKLKVENSGQATLRFCLIIFCAQWKI